MKKLLICVLTCFSLVGCNNSTKSSSLTNGIELLKKGFTIQGTFTSDKEYYQNSGYDIPTGDSEKFSYYVDATYQNDKDYIGVDRRYYKVDENGNKSYSHGENAYSNNGYLYYNYLDYDNVVKNDACSYVDYYNVAPYASSGYTNPFTLMDATDFEETGDNKYAINNLKGTIFYNYLFGTLENNTPYIQVDTTSFVFNDNDELTTIDFVTKPFYSSETYGDEYQVIYTKTVFTAKLTVSNVGNANAKDLMKAEEEKPENDVLGTALNNLKNAQSLTIDRHLIPYVDGELQPQEECVTLYYDGSHIYNQVWEYNTENGEIPQKASASDTYLEADKTGLMEVYTLNDDGETFSKDSLKGNYFASINRLYSYGEKFDKQAIIDRICENSILKGITISGGEPLCKENIPEVLDFIKDVKKVRPNFNVWCYTGYTLEQLEDRNDAVTNETLKNIDVLVDGKFVEAQKNPTLKFKGSENQRILDVQECLKEHKIVQVNL